MERGHGYNSLNHNNYIFEFIPLSYNQNYPIFSMQLFISEDLGHNSEFFLEGPNDKAVGSKTARITTKEKNSL